MTENEKKLNESINQISFSQTQILDKMESMVKQAVKETVNGKLDPNSPTYAFKRIDDHLAAIDEHMEQTKDIMEALQGVRALGEGIKWVSGVALALAGVWALLIGRIKL